MKVIAVDNDREDLLRFCMEVENIPRVEIASMFTDPWEALEYIKENPVEAAFLDIEMPEMNGLVLAERLREISPRIVIIFIAAYEQYTLDALKVKADYYMMKPYDENEILDVMERAKLLSLRQRKRAYFRTFGRFDLFVDRKVVYFSNMKAKELLALCVDRRGGCVTLQEAVDKLWEGRAYDDKVRNLYRKAVMYIRQLLNERDISDIFQSNRGSCSIDAMNVDCDYYSLLQGNKDAIRAWTVAGGYLQEYSWAEETSARLEYLYYEDMW